MHRSRRVRNAGGAAALLVVALVASLGLAGPADIAAAAQPTVTITGTVTGGDESGPAVPSASLRLDPAGGGSGTVRTGTSADDGSFSLTDVPLREAGYTLTITPASGSEYLAASLGPIIPTAEGPNVVAAVVPTGARIDGTVLLTDGSSPAGAQVTVMQGQRTVAVKTVDASGTFVVAGLGAGDYSLRAVLSGTGSASAQVQGAVPGQIYPITLSLLSPGVVSGTVTSSVTGEGLGGIEVQRSGQRAVTDAQGAYQIRAAKIGTYGAFYIDPAGAYAQTSVEQISVATAQIVDAVDVQMEPAAAVSGIVRGTDGNPLAGVTVTSDQFDSLVQLSAVSDAEGRYRIAGITAGTYTLVGRPTERPATLAHIETPGPVVTLVAGQELTGADLSMDGFTLVTGTLTREAPLEGTLTDFFITYYSLDEFTEESHTPLPRSARVDAEGHYSLLLPPARYLIRIGSPRVDLEPVTDYVTKWWENNYSDVDPEYPSSLLREGGKMLIVERNTPVSVDLTIDRGNPFTRSPDPVVTGVAAPGQTLTASVGAWSPTPDAFRYEWRRDGVPIPGATELSYRLTDADNDKAITFAATGSRGPDFVATLVSTTVTPARTLDPSPVPVIQGTPNVGSTLTAVAGTWGPEPVTLGYQWERSGTAVPDAVGSTYLVQPADAATRITVTVTGSKSGYPSVAKTSAAVTVPAPPPTVERIAGADRYEESALISQRLAPGGSALVYLASGEGFADALSGSAIAAQRDAPLLLSARSAVPATVAAEIRRLAPDDIVVLGGENTLSPAVIDQLKALVSGVEVHRIGGADRYTVSRTLILDPDFGAAASQNLYVATGRTFPDALSGAPAAAHIDSPVLLVDGQRTSFTSAERSLLRDRAVKLVTILGGTASVSGGLQSQLGTLGVSVGRVAGADRYVVSAKIAAQSFPTRYSRDVVYIASGENFPDALAGGALAGSGYSTPLYLAQKGCLDQAMIDHILALQAEKIVILGGPNSIAFDGFPIAACPARASG